MKHNTMNKAQDGKIAGTFVSRSMNESFELIQNADRRGNKPPTHLIIARAPAGHMYQAGIAYEHDIKNGEQAGRTGFYLIFNDPDFGENGVAVSGFPNATMGWDLSLERKKREAAPAQEQQAA